MKMKKITILICFATCIMASGFAEIISLIDSETPTSGWNFDNGREFGGGAEGFLEAVKEASVPTLRLSGDFSKAGHYVQMSKSLDVNVSTLMFDVKAPKDRETMTIRLIDQTSQCHQIKIRLKGKGEWEPIVFSIKDFFANKGTSAAVDFVKQYENWGGAKDAKWTNPLLSIVFLFDHRKDLGSKGFIEFRNIKLLTVKSEAEKIYSFQRLKLDEILQVGEIDWNLYRGDAAGTIADLKLIQNMPKQGDYGLDISADFSKTAAGKPQYIEVSYPTKYPSSVKFKRLNFKYRSTKVPQLGLRLTDGSGQTHQVKRSVEADGEWHEYSWTIKDIVGRESWGGAGDKQWHDSVQKVAFIIGHQADSPKQVAMDITDISLDVEMESAKTKIVYVEKFENDINDWKVEGEAVLTKENTFEGKSSFVLNRSSIDSEVAKAYGPIFSTTENRLKISGATSSQLEGLDNSFKGVIGIQWMDGNDKVVDSSPLFDQWKKQNWQKFSKEVVVPNGANKARFFVEIQKATGDYFVDDLLVETVAVVSLFQERISKVKISLDCVGNMPFPGDDIVFKITSICEKPLPKSWLNLHWTITDYWGNKVFSSRNPSLLERLPKTSNGKRFDYATEIDVTKLPLEVGKYYEMHISIPRDGAEPYSDYKSFAILPEPETFKYPAGDIPFTTRSWDNRISDYVRLSHRIGHRTAGVWGRFNITPPFKTSLANSALAEELNMSILSTSQINNIEKHLSGWTNITIDIMVAGTQNIIHDKHMKDLIYMGLGNEPPENLERAQEVLPYYKAVYEIIKKERPEIQVIGTAVGPSEIYFKTGFGAYQDMYDFHTYEDYRRIPRIFKQYKDLFEKYGHEKPICSTEIGLNSQGQPRYDVAISLVKKFSVFFACGGAHVSWFGIMYPDPEAKIFGGGEDSHNTFDCRYNIYSPRLDAIAYYYMMNGILNKKFVEKKLYGSTEVYLFADDEGDCFTVIWNDNEFELVSIPFDGVSEVEVTRLDNSSHTMIPKDASITLRVGEEPIMLKYNQSKPALPTTIEKPSFNLVNVLSTMAKGATDTMTIVGDKISSKDFIVKVPVGWNSQLVDDDGNVKLTLSVPQDAIGRIGRVYVQHTSAGKTSGEAILNIAMAPPLEIVVTALPKKANKEPEIKLILKNNGTHEEEAFWDIKILGELNMANGTYKLNELGTSTAFFSGDSSGMEILKAGAVKELLIPVSKFDGTTIYKIKAKISDSTGRSSSSERYIGGLAGAKKTAIAPKIDGILNDECWKNALPVYINDEKQLFVFGEQKEEDKWSGVDDLSAEIRYAWDDDYLYIAVSGKDDVFANPGQDAYLWRMDGIQMLVDPSRDKPIKSGKYDYVFGNGQKGLQAWCSLSANSRVPSGLVESIKMGFDDKLVKDGKFSYELAIPWKRVYPFTPSVGANLGVAIIMNEDDGFGRASFMGWFSGVHSKQLDLVGDVILED